MSQNTQRLRLLATASLVGGVLLLLALALLPLGASAQGGEQDFQEHVVVPGETLYGIAARYGVSVEAIADANDISNPDVIRIGSKLLIPAPPGQVGRVHFVQRGDSLTIIAARYDISVDDLVAANSLSDRNYLFVGQRLFIPVPEEPEAAPAGPEAAPACPGGCEAISIMSPTRNMTVTNPVQVSGFGSAFEQTLVIRVLDATGFEIGLGYGQISGTLGALGPYTGVVTYTTPAATQPGRIQVYSLSPRDGAIEHLASVVVTLEGAGLDDAIGRLKAALEAKDYEALEPLLVDQFVLAFYQSEGLLLSPARALAQLQANYLGPGEVVVDLSVDAAALLGDNVMLSPDVTHVLFSTGWGPDQADDAFLLLVEDEAGQTRWGGMLYVFEALQDYREAGP